MFTQRFYTLTNTRILIRRFQPLKLRRSSLPSEYRDYPPGQILVRDRVRVWRSQRHIPRKYYGVYPLSPFHSPPPPREVGTFSARRQEIPLLAGKWGCSDDLQRIIMDGAEGFFFQIPILNPRSLERGGGREGGQIDLPLNFLPLNFFYLIDC